MSLDILSSSQKSLIPLVSSFSPHFGLVEGTAIALHLGHRRSIDFDLFSLEEFSVQSIRTKLSQSTQIEHTFIQGENELTVLVNGVKLTFFYFPYPISFTEKTIGDVLMPDLLTLGAMKMFALGRRAKWKDYVDMYFLLQSFDFSEITDKANQLFGSEFNEKLCRVQLSYFEDIDYSEEVEFMEGFKVSDKVVRQSLQEISLQI